MNDLRMKITAFAVVLGLGALGGYAMGSNDQAAAPSASTPTPTTEVVRRTVHAKPKHRASGAGSPTASQSGAPAARPVSTGTSGASGSSYSPVGTGTSGAGGGSGGESDDSGEAYERGEGDD